MLRKRHVAAELEAKLASARQRIFELEREIETLGLRDPVTSLPNLAAFERHLEGEVARCRRRGRALALAVIDVDGFRALNARHGRPVGDRLLSTVGLVLDRFTRASDVVCRASADEFLVMLPETGGKEASEAFGRIQLELEAAESLPSRASRCPSASRSGSRGWTAESSWPGTRRRSTAPGWRAGAGPS